jgi:LCP family protein required for cell wall assembly
MKKTPASDGRTARAVRRPHRVRRALLRALVALAAVLVVGAGGLYGFYRWVARDIRFMPIPIQPQVVVGDGSLDDVVLPDDVTPDPTPTDPPGGPLPTPVDGELGEWDLKRLRSHYTVPIEYRARQDAMVENLLLIATDRRYASTLGNTDLIMVVSIDRRRGVVRTISVLRDTRLKIPGRTLENKINTAYALGGPGLLINTLNSYLGLDIQRYVLVDIPSSIRFIDICGGVRVSVDEAERAALGFDGTGLLLLDGRQATSYAGLREIDSDKGRTGLQREVVAAMLDSFRAADRARQLQLVQSGLSLMETNMSQDEILLLMARALPAITGTSGFVVPSEGTYVRRTGDAGGNWLEVDWEAARAALARFLSTDAG